MEHGSAIHKTSFQPVVATVISGSLTFTASDLAELENVAKALVKTLAPPLLVTLSGNLGAGKTTLVSQMLKQWGVMGSGSPTFNLRNDYRTENFRILHLDFYRLKPSDSAWDLLPPDEDFSDAIVFAEWPEKVHSGIFATFTARAQISITAEKDGTRKISYEAAA